MAGNCYHKTSNRSRLNVSFFKLLLLPIGMILLHQEMTLAQPTPPKGGRPFPEIVRRVMQRDPNAYQFKRAYINNDNTPERPAHMSAWSKAELGWLIPAVVTTDLVNWPIATSTTTPTAFKLWSGGTPGSEYFLVEYRTRQGFDDQLHAEGLLIWHIDDGVGTNWNKDETNKRVDLECADQTGVDHTADADDLDRGLTELGGAGGNRGDATDPFCDGDEFTATTNPSNVAYNGINTSVEVRNIGECGNPQQLIADLIVGEPGRDVNLCMRDCEADVCGEPTHPGPCPKWWASPEIFIDNNGDGIIDPPDIDHYCIGVIATNADDGQSSESAPEDNNVAQINIQELYAKAGDAVPPILSLQNQLTGESTANADTVFTAERVVQVCNFIHDQANCQIVIGSPPDFDDAVIPAGWEIELELNVVVLGRNECVPLKVRAKKNNPVHLDSAIVPLTLICNDHLAGGNILEFHIDLETLRNQELPSVSWT